MTGQWPPEWDDPDDITEEAGRRDAETEAGLSEVATYLASVPAPVMPGSVEARISAALAVEAAARSGIATPASGGAKGNGTVKSDGPVQPDGAPGARVLGPAPARARVRRHEGRRTRREREMRKIYEARPERDIRRVLGRFVLGPLAVCLLVAVIAVGLSHAGSSSSSSSANSAAGAPRAAGAASSAPGASGGFGYSSATSGELAPGPAASASASAAAGFVVIQTGTSYQRATLAQQARAQVHAAQERESASTTAPSATSPSPPPSATSASLSSLAPTGRLRACVLAVTGGVSPQLVDRATYQGTPAYVIASSSHVWVVGLGCTAARPQVLASVPLAG